MMNYKQGKQIPVRMWVQYIVWGSVSYVNDNQLDKRSHIMVQKRVPLLLLIYKIEKLMVMLFE